MHTLPLFYPTPCMPSPYSIPPHGCPPLFYLPTPCMPPYSIPAHAWPPPILSQPMHTLPLFYSTPCMPSPNSIPAYAHHPPIIFHPMHVQSLFYPTLCMPSLYSIPPNACPLLVLSQPMHVLLAPCHKHLEGMFLYGHLSMPLLNLLTPVYHHHLPSLVIWSINLWHHVLNVCCFHSHELTTWITC